MDKKLRILKLFNFFKKLHSSFKTFRIRHKNLKECLRYNPHRAWGFTIMEMILVLFITVVIASITLVGLRSGSAQGRLTRSAARVALDLRRAQNLALTSLVQQSGAVFGFGVYFFSAEPEQYIRFFDRNNDNMRASDGTEDIEIVKFEDGVVIDNLSSGPSSLTIYFKSPEPTTFIWNGGSPVSNGIITLTVQGESTLIEQIFVNDFGLVEF